jgi:hypothetical protein
MSKDDGLPDIVIEHNWSRYGVFSWQGQAPQYDQLGPPGEIVYRRYFDGKALDSNAKATIDTPLHYYDDGHLDGIVNTFPFGKRGGKVNRAAEPSASPPHTGGRSVGTARSGAPPVDHRPDSCAEAGLVQHLNNDDCTGNGCPTA